MNIALALAEAMHRNSPPPKGGWLDRMDEAFAALNEDGSVMCIGYKGEWYFTRKPSLRTRLHNWLIRIGSRGPQDEER